MLPHSAFSRVCHLVYLLKTAWTEVSLLIDTRHVGAVPEHAPLQFTNCFPVGGVAVNVTTVPEVNFAEQFPPQFNCRSLPFGVPTMVPGLLRPTDNVNWGRNDALTCIGPLTTTEQVSAVPLQAPPQPVKTKPPGFAVSVCVEPFGAKTEHAFPQLSFPLTPLTDPLPVRVTEITSGDTLMAEFCALMKSPSSPGDGALQRFPSAQIAS